LEERRLAGSARHGKKVGLGDLTPVPPISLAARNRSFRTISEVKSPNQIHEALTKLSKLPSTYSTEWEWEC